MTPDPRETIGGDWIRRPDGFWLAVRPDAIPGAAERMLASGARFAALVATPDGSGNLAMSWHWDCRGTLLTLHTALANGQSAPSIAQVYPGADWAERETHDYYAVTFAGRADTTPLVLRAGDTPGILLANRGGAR
jgi:hypothetical protein